MVEQRDITTDVIRKGGLNLSPETRIHLKLGTLYGVISAAVTAAIFIWTIKAKVDSTYDEVAAIRTEIKPVITHTAILWDEHERSASRLGWSR